MNKNHRPQLLFIFLLFICVCLSCVRRSEEHNNLTENELNTRLLIKNTEYFLLSFIENSIEFGQVDSSATFVLVLSQKNIFCDSTANDSLIYMSTLNCNDLIFKDGYVGVTKISNKTVAIFDNTSFGQMIYNPEKLIYIPVESLKCSELKMRGVQSYKIKNKELVKWK